MGRGQSMLVGRVMVSLVPSNQRHLPETHLSSVCQVAPELAPSLPLPELSHTSFVPPEHVLSTPSSKDQWAMGAASEPPRAARIRSKFRIATGIRQIKKMVKKRRK